MNPVEIEQALTEFADQPFDAAEFPFRFLECFGNKPTTLKRLRSGNSNSSDVDRGVLQRSNIHLATCATGAIASTLELLRESPATAKAKAPLILATDGVDLEAENVITGETIACNYGDFPDHFGFLLSLAGIQATSEIRNNPIDIKATGRLNRLYIELLKHNEDWGTDERRHDLNQFMTRLIFCFFPEDTGNFSKDDMFTKTVEQMSDGKSENTHEVISTLFHALDLESDDRETAELPRWTRDYPYVNGALFSGTRDVPKFSRIARSYLLHAGNLNWKEINPDIFGSMIQAVADDEERGSIGMHYTSVPNILKVLNPLFLDSLREQLEAAEDNARKLANLKKRISRIRVFDPACGSGNFLVIAYKEMRAIEYVIHQRRNETHLKSDIPLDNFRGIEIREFPTEIARLALIIAEYQCDELYRGQKDAIDDFLPLDSKNWIVVGNALRLDWLSICPPKIQTVKHNADDLFETPLEQTTVKFTREGSEIYICSNPPYLGSQWQSSEQKKDLGSIFDQKTSNWKSLDYVSGWILKSAEYAATTGAAAAFVSTNTICQGRQVSTLWPLIFELGPEIFFAHTSLKWSNLATNKAGVTVVLIGIKLNPGNERKLYTKDKNNEEVVRFTNHINAYLITGSNIIVNPSSSPIQSPNEMSFGNMPNEGGHLLLDKNEVDQAINTHNVDPSFIRPFIGSQEFIRGTQRYCIWVTSEDYSKAAKNQWLARRFADVRATRIASKRASTKKLAEIPFQFGEVRQSGKERTIVIPGVSSENREFLPVGVAGKGTIIGNKNFALYNAPLWNLAIIASRIHRIWIGTVCVRMRTDFSYSNTLGWNTFALPALTEKNKADLNRCAEDILLAREAHFPKTIAELYKPEDMPDNLRLAHEKNDETLERIYIGRKFNNDTERLEKLFELYTTMTTNNKMSNPNPL